MFKSTFCPSFLALTYSRPKGLERPILINIFTNICPTHLQHLDDLGRELHQGGARDAPVDPIDEDAGPDGVRHRPELGLLVGPLPGGGQLAGERGRQPLAHLRRDRIRLHLGQLIVFVGQASGMFAGWGRLVLREKERITILN